MNVSTCSLTASSALFIINNMKQMETLNVIHYTYVRITHIICIRMESQKKEIKNRINELINYL